MRVQGACTPATRRIGGNAMGELNAGTAAGGAARMQGRRVVVTGGASGIGRATARLFAAHGAKVAIIDRDGAAAAAVAGELGGIGIGIAADVSDAAQVDSAVRQAADRLSGIDGIVNAAGIPAMASVGDTTPELWRRLIEVNLTGPFLVIRAALSYLQAEAGATIVNISSGAALIPRPYRVAYIASKAGVLGLTRALAIELAPAIRVNAICPGMIDTPILDKGASTSPELVNRAAMKRLGTAEEMANSILYLSSSESSFTTGITLAADGGRNFH